MPTEPADLFGPCIFTQVPSIDGVRIHGNQGVARWHGKTADPELPDDGYILFRKAADGIWRVRQICFYDDMAKFALLKMRLCRESQAEIAVKESLCKLGQDYCDAWLHREYETMRSLWYDWPHKTLTDDKPVKLSIKSAKVITNFFHESCVHLVVKVQLPIPLLPSKEYKCDLVVMNVEGQWKVRGSRIEFYQ